MIELDTALALLARQVSETAHVAELEAQVDQLQTELLSAQQIALRLQATIAELKAARSVREWSYLQNAYDRSDRSKDGTLSTGHYFS